MNWITITSKTLTHWYCILSKSFPRFIAILTVTTARSSLKHEPVVDRPVSPQVQQIPVTDDDGRQVFSDDQDIVAQMQSRRAAFQFSAGQHRYTETVDWETENKHNDVHAPFIQLRTHTLDA